MSFPAVGDGGDLTQFGQQRPLLPGTLTGIRSWRQRPDGTLTGVHFQQPWGAGLNDAICLQHPALDGALEEFDPDHQVGQLGCTCGFYAYFDTESNPHHYHNQNAILGLIRGHGVVTYGTRGFRCSKARIVALIDEAYGPLTTTWGDVARAVIAALPLMDRLVAPPPPRPPSSIPETVRAAYPKVPVFRGLAAALRAFPLTPLQLDAGTTND